MIGGTAPFAPFEWLIAWRFLRARRREGGISAMTWISVAGIALGVAAMILTLAVRTGFRAEFTDRILGANAHVALYRFESGRPVPIAGFDALAERVRAVPGVVRAAPLVRGQVMATAHGRNAGLEVYGERLADLQTLRHIARPEWSQGDLGRIDEGIAVGEGLARELNLFVGDTLTLISPDGAFTPFGRSLRASSYEVVYIFKVGRSDIDRTRAYLPLAAAQLFFNRDGTVDQIETMVAAPASLGRNPDHDALTRALAGLAPGIVPWTWQDSEGGFLDALTLEDNVMFLVLAIVVTVAAMNITSGLVMLVKNKGREIGILRTMGLSRGAVMRIFILCGMLVGGAGTALGVALGTLAAIWIDPIFATLNWLLGGGGWDPRKWFLSELPSELVAGDVLRAAGLALGLAFLVTILPARRAARLDPAEALRYE